MLVRLRSARGRLLPHGWTDILRQLVLFGGAYLLYTIVRGAANGEAAAAFKHARQLISVERALHLFVEPSVQAWASGSHFLMGTATWLYLNAQTTVLLATLLYLYLFHNRNFYFVRNMLMVAMTVGLVGYIFFPTAPPRFLPEWGFFDSIAQIAHISPNSVPSAAFFNPYAAIPSMHVAFALMLGWTLARLVRPRALRLLWWLYPFVIAFVTVATANHFLLDTIFGAATAALAFYAAARLARIRPHAWEFAPSPVAAT
jgi:membrane-associated phospholipid phosphatase